jgi:undecaprenyl-diphosphatase
MEWFEALILGLIQGLTEFLPVSSSAHLEIGKALFGIKGEENFYFSIMVHGATVLSTLVVFWKDILKLIKGFFKFKYNEETSYIFKIFVSMIPVLIVGLLFKEHIEKLFAGNSFVFIGSMLIVTAALLFFTYFFKNKKQRDINYLDAFIIGISQAIAVVPGISRSGATIATGNPIFGYAAGKGANMAVNAAQNIITGGVNVVKQTTGVVRAATDVTKNTVQKINKAIKSNSDFKVHRRN